MDRMSCSPSLSLKSNSSEIPTVVVGTSLFVAGASLVVVSSGWVSSMFGLVTIAGLRGQQILGISLSNPQPELFRNEIFSLLIFWPKIWSNDSQSVICTQLPSSSVLVKHAAPCLPETWKMKIYEKYYYKTVYQLVGGSHGWLQPERSQSEQSC